MPPPAAIAPANVASAKPMAPPPAMDAPAPVVAPPPPPPPPAPEYARDEVQAQAAAPALARGVVSNETVPAARAKSAPIAAGFAAGRPAYLRKDAALASNVRWTISGSPRGVVQRSADGGATWHDVALGDGISFRAVASNGPDVWAGGSAGALFHSTDGGAHWQRIAIDTNGTIIEIRASGAGEVTVATDTPERLTSTDNGRTWR